MSATDEVSWNGETYSRDAFQAAVNIVAANTTAGISRDPAVLKKLGEQYGGDRDIYEVLGYPDDVTAKEYRARYERQDLGHRIVKIFSDDTWKIDPEVIDDAEVEGDTSFETAVQQLADEAKLFHFLRRADKVSGIGEYGLLLLGLRDGQSLGDEPNPNVLNGPDDLAFMTPFAQDNVESWLLGKDVGMEPSEERYNKPVLYTIDFSGSDDDDDDLREVHWRRIIHIAEGRDENDLKGTPRMQPVLNRLIDREKVVGASAEMFYAGADRKFHFDIKSDDSSDIPDDELSDLDDEVQKLVHNMQNYLKTFNTDVNVISGQEVDPSGVIKAIDQSISAAIGVPVRILQGSERGELASSQDRATWFGRVEVRQHRHAGPMILRKTVDRLRELSILPDPDAGTYTVEWPNLFELTELEKSEVWDNRASALSSASISPDEFGTPEQRLEFITEGAVPEFEVEEEIQEPDVLIDEDDEQTQEQFSGAFPGTGPE